LAPGHGDKWGTGPTPTDFLSGPRPRDSYRRLQGHAIYARSTSLNERASVTYRKNLDAEPREFEVAI
jgi:hypothetical protein